MPRSAHNVSYGKDTCIYNSKLQLAKKEQHRKTNYIEIPTSDPLPILITVIL